MRQTGARPCFCLPVRMMAWNCRGRAGGRAAGRPGGCAPPPDLLFMPTMRVPAPHTGLQRMSVCAGRGCPRCMRRWCLGGPFGPSCAAVDRWASTRPCCRTWSGPRCWPLRWACTGCDWLSRHPRWRCVPPPPPPVPSSDLACSFAFPVAAAASSSVRCCRPASRCAHRGAHAATILQPVRPVAVHALPRVVSSRRVFTCAPCVQRLPGGPKLLAAVRLAVSDAEGPAVAPEGDEEVEALRGLVATLVPVVSRSYKVELSKGAH